jgi:hypothetical protein
MDTNTFKTMFKTITIRIFEEDYALIQAQELMEMSPLQIAGAFSDMLWKHHQFLMSNGSGEAKRYEAMLEVLQDKNEHFPDFLEADDVDELWRKTYELLNKKKEELNKKK